MPIRDLKRALRNNIRHHEENNDGLSAKIERAALEQIEELENSLDMVRLVLDKDHLTLSIPNQLIHPSYDCPCLYHYYNHSLIPYLDPYSDSDPYSAYVQAPAYQGAAN